MSFFAIAHGEMHVDGHFDEPEWQQAVHCSDWQRTEPFALDQPRFGNDVRIVATPQGLAAGFTIDQPRGERRDRPRTPRDSENLIGDSVGLIVDFDATGQVGYEFSVGLGGGVRDGLVTNQNQFDRDWDGAWQYVVRESDDQWFVEMLIPWDTVNMRAQQEDSRTIGIYATRFLFGRNERFACPGISQTSPAFLADFQHIAVSQYQAPATLDFVPYVTSVRDNISGDVDFKGGADVSWKPSQNVWLTATLNPDFGQVESDELVVDFSAIETVQTDKRPFFTENQGIFDLRMPANGQLIYTRRVGAAPDDGSAGSSDIDGAFKITGNARNLAFGAFVAQEHDFNQEFGRRFAASRLALPFAYGRIGYVGTWTDHPLLDRSALVNAFDYDITPNDWWRLAGQVIRSDISTAGGGNDDGYETWLQIDMNRSGAWTHTLRLLNIDADFDLNDLGYLERNSLRQAEWDTSRRVASADEAARVSGETQRLYLIYRENTLGQRLQSRVQLSREVRYRSAWLAYEELRVIPGGVDDLISRGNGPVNLDTRYSLYGDFTSPRNGNWQYVVGGYVFQQGVEGYSGWLQLSALWYPSEKLTLRLDLLPQYSDDWLLWQQDNLFGTYRADRLDFNFRLDWIPAPRHELRIKWQWIGIDATPRQAWRADASGDLRPVAAYSRATVAGPTGPQVTPFTVNNLGLQIRYRYEIGPQSDLFLVYGRGGYELLNDDDRAVRDLFTDMGDVRDADQFMIKFRYRL